MTYSAVGLLAVAVLLIVNQDVIFRPGESKDIPALSAYRRFLFAVLAYFVTDFAWGVFDALHFSGGIYVDTVIYFMTMAIAILFWTKYVIAYLDVQTRFRTFMLWAGWIFVAYEFIVLIINFFYPILFWMDMDSGYHTSIFRHITLLLQVVMFLLTSVFTLAAAREKAGEAISKRHRTIGLFGLIMIFLIVLQMRYPLLPLYSVGYLLGTCLLHTFVIEDEKEEYRSNLEAALEREKDQRQELGLARHMAYTDSLTGVKSKHAYAEYEEQIDLRIADGEMEEFAIAVFDVNDLKKINDTMGHDVGDQYIKSASHYICKQFQHSPVFRIGGDEFVAILERDDFLQRVKLQNEFNALMDANARKEQVVVSLGMSDYIPLHDNSFRRTFERADQKMYHRKKELKDRMREENLA